MGRSDSAAFLALLESHLKFDRKQSSWKWLTIAFIHLNDTVITLTGKWINIVQYFFIFSDLASRASSTHVRYSRTWSSVVFRCRLILWWCWAKLSSEYTGLDTKYCLLEAIIIVSQNLPNAGTIFQRYSVLWWGPLTSGACLHAAASPICSLRSLFVFHWFCWLLCSIKRYLTIIISMALPLSSTPLQV